MITFQLSDLYLNEMTKRWITGGLGNIAMQDLTPCFYFFVVLTINMQETE
jgi:hypothetical protein